MLKKSIRVTIYTALAVVLVAVVGGYSAWRSPAVARWLVDRAVHLAAAPDLAVEYAGVAGTLDSGLVIHDLVVRRPPHLEVRLARVRLRLDGVAVAIGLLHLPQVAVEGAVVTLGPGGFSEGAGAVPWWLPPMGRVDRLAVTDLEIRGQGQVFPVHLSLEGRAGYGGLPALVERRGWLRNVTATVRLAGGPATAGRLARLDVDREGVHWRELTLTAGGSRVVLAGTLGGVDDFHVTWRTDGCDPAEFGAPWSVKLRGEGSVASLPPAAELGRAAAARSAAWPDLAWRYTGTLWDRPLEAQGEVRRWQRPAAEIQARLRFSELDGPFLGRMAQVLGVSLPPELDLQEVAGSLFLRYRPSAAVPIQGTIQVDRGRLAGFAITQGTAQCQAGADRLQCSAIVLDGDPGRLEAGEAWVARDGDWQLRGRLRRVALPPAMAQGGGLPPVMAGRLEVARRRGTVSGRLALDPLEIGGRRVTRAEGRFTLAGGGLRLADGRLAGDFGQLTLSGRLGLEDCDLVFTGPSLEVGAMVPGLAGRLAVQGTIQGPWRRAAVQARFQAVAVTGYGGRAEEVQGTLLLPDWRLRQGLRLQAGIGRLQGGGLTLTAVEFGVLCTAGDTVRLDRLALTAGGRRWQLAQPVSWPGAGGAVGPLVMVAGEQRLAVSLTPQADGRVMLDGTLDLADMGWVAQPRVTLSGAIQTGNGAPAADLRLAAGGTLAGRPLAATALLTHDGSGWRAQGTVQLDGQEAGHFSLALPAAAPGWRGLGGTLEIPALPLASLPLAAGFAPPCQGGVLRGHFTVDGRGPSWLTGRLAVADADCRIPTIEVAVDGLEAAVSLDGQGLAMDGALHAGEDRLTVAGRLGWDRHLQLQLTSAGLDYDFHGHYRGRAAVTARLAGPLTRPLITGTVTALGDLQVHGPGQGPAAGDLRILPSRQTTGGERAQDGTVDLDVELVLPETVALVAEGMRLELSGRLRVRMDDQGHRYDGQLSVHGGSYRAGQRRFDLRPGGAIRFPGRQDFDPDLSLQADCRLPDLQVTAYVGGTMDQPDIVLESTPWLPEEAIKASLVVGRAVDQREAAAGGAMASILSDTILGRFQDVTGYDTLVDAVSFYTDEGSGTTTVAVDKYLGKDLILGYAWDLGTETGGLRLEYRLRGGFSLESMFSEEGQESGLDLIWKKDF